VTWSRRAFVRTFSLGVGGLIFVPKYERWFRPNRIIVNTFEHWPNSGYVDLYTGAPYDPAAQFLARVPLPPIWGEPGQTAFGEVERSGLLGHARATVPHPYERGKTMEIPANIVLASPQLSAGMQIRLHPPFRISDV
jgi:hypothetical protein